MRKAIKKRGKLVHAVRLGDGSATEERLIAEGKIVKRGDVYEIFTRETAGEKGETAQSGDYCKIDTDGMPYPNEKVFFEQGHRHIEGEMYEQIPKPLYVWTAEDEICDELRFLQAHKSLRLDEENPESYFSAPLWGTVLTAARDAFLVFYSVERDANGSITDADFNFVAREEFDKTYSFI